MIPTLRLGDIVVMDNLRTHHIQAVSELLRGARAQVLYLPPYSPDLNPIEKLWSKVKAVLRKLRVRSPMRWMPRSALPLTKSPPMIVMAGFPAPVIAYFENCPTSTS